MTSYQADKNQIIQNLVDYPLLIIDESGNRTKFRVCFGAGL